MKIQQPGGHLDQMIRQTRNHHVQLSSIADIKANMLLTMSSVVITLSAPNLAHENLKYPILVLMAFCLLTILLAVYTVMPKVPLSQRPAPPPDVTSPSFNVLFFGDFMRLPYATYEETMEKMMSDPSRTYEAQIREIYTLGMFLAKKKYRYLGYAYLAFITGLLASGAVLVATNFWR